MRHQRWVLTLLVVFVCTIPALAAETKRAAAPDVGRSGSPVAYTPVERRSTDGRLAVQAPLRAEQGGVLLVRLVSQDSVPSISLSWNEKKMSLPVKPGVNGGFEAEALLPVPVDAAGGKPMELQVRAGKSSLALPVQVRAVNWPRQEIKVENRYVTPPRDVTERIAREREKVGKILGTVSPETRWAVPFVRPVPGEPSSVFGGRRVFNGQPRSMHRGVDLRGAMGSPVTALAAGRVVLAEEQYFSGNVVYLDHGQGFITLYAHLSAFAVREGDFVEAGQTVGQVGATGRVTGPHLHLGALLRGQAVNPLALFVVE